MRIFVKLRAVSNGAGQTVANSIQTVAKYLKCNLFSARQCCQFESCRPRKQVGRNEGAGKEKRRRKTPQKKRKKPPDFLVTGVKRRNILSRRLDWQGFRTREAQGVVT